MPLITEMFAFIVKDEPNSEGVVRFRAPNGDWMPMVGADMERVEAFRPFAQAMANHFGKPITVIRFTDRQDMDTIMPVAVTYEILEDGKAIKCLRCEAVSHNQNDVANLYCGKCHEYHVKG